MKRKLINIIITGLLVTITILSLFTYNTFNKNKKLKTQQLLNNQIKQEQTFRIIDNSTIINKLNNVCSINILQGETEANIKYSNQKVSDEDVYFK